MVGIIAGLGGGVVMLILMDQLDKSVKTLDGLKSIGVPVLALIPRIVDPAEVVLSRRRDLLLYVLSAAYFSLILLVLGIEAARPAFLDSLFKLP